MLFSIVSTMFVSNALNDTPDVVFLSRFSRFGYYLGVFDDYKTEIQTSWRKLYIILLICVAFALCSIKGPANVTFYKEPVKYKAIMSFFEESSELFSACSCLLTNILYEKYWKEIFQKLSEIDRNFSFKNGYFKVPSKLITSLTVFLIFNIFYDNFAGYLEENGDTGVYLFAFEFHTILNCYKIFVMICLSSVIENRYDILNDLLFKFSLNNEKMAIIKINQLCKMYIKLSEIVDNLNVFFGLTTLFYIAYIVIQMVYWVALEIVHDKNIIFILVSICYPTFHCVQK